MEEPHLQVVDFIMVFMLRVQEPVYRREAEEVIWKLRGLGGGTGAQNEEPTVLHRLYCFCTRLQVALLESP